MARERGDAASQERIIKHMNADHQDSLRRYLEFYCLIPSSIARHARVVEFTLDHMIITSTGTRNIIPFDPPLQSYSEARPRVVQMDHDALKGLGRSDITVREYLPPNTGLHYVVLGGVLLSLVLTSRRQTLFPGSFIYDTFLHHTPRFTSFLRIVSTPIFYFIVGVHSAEAVWFERSRLSKYNVPTFSGLWWTWLISTIAEGFGAYQRFDGLVARAQNEKDQAKH